MGAREELYSLIQKLPENELQAARRFLEYLCGAAEDPVERALREAPYDDEPVTPEEAAAIDEALEEAKDRGAVSWDEMMRRLDLNAKR